MKKAVEKITADFKKGVDQAAFQDGFSGRGKYGMEENRELQLEYAERLTRVEGRAKSNSHRLEVVEGIVSEIKILATTTKELAIELKHTNRNIDEIKEKVQLLEGEPAKKWKEYTGHAIKVLIGILIGAMGSGLLEVFK